MLLLFQDLKTLSKKIKDVQTELKWSKTGKESEAGGSRPMESEEGVINYGEQKIVEIKTSVQSTLTMIDDAEKIGIDTAAKLAGQGEQLQIISNDLYEIEDTLKRAQEITRRMARRVLTDRYVWALTVLIVLAIIGIIALKATGKTVTGSYNSA
eukprot:TRINITY_DN627_c0_g1_i2.p1 TRINITY_DN627_c0_g1~~TRINITY_DN627_c0_g1_i2.p1  ORF type:complete len:154 (-),score=41.96 TRINITY_DN627_c0_g1_i2:98-559(-)